MNEKLTDATSSYCPYGAVSSLRLNPRTAPSLRSGLSWAIFDSSLRDDGAAQLDESAALGHSSTALLGVFLTVKLWKRRD
jgi:hypothetical protein